MDWFEILWTTSFWVAAVRIATPLIFGTLGELVCERAGVLNLGIEGIMTLGAMTGWMSVYMGADLWTGVILAAMVGSLLGALHSMLTVSPWIVPACYRHRHHPVGFQPLLLHLSVGASGSDISPAD